MVRKHRADSIARSAHPTRNFPVGQWREGAIHLPIFASVPRPWRTPKPRDGDRDIRVDTESLIADLQHGSERLTEMRCFARSLLLQCSDLNAYSDALLNAATKYYPSQVRPQAIKPWQDVQIVSRAKAMWTLFREMRQHSTMGLSRPFQAWRKWSQFQKMHKEHKKLGKSFRRTRRLNLLQEAEQAAAKHDMRSLYQLVEQIAPRKRRTQMRILNTQGELQTKAGMLRDLRTHYTERFRANSRHEHRFHANARQLPYSITLSEDEIIHNLRRIPLRKAVPAGWAPGPVWQACADDIAPLLYHALQNLWHQGAHDIPTSWVNAWLIFLIKGGKCGHKAADYRPIGLLCPLGKAVLAAITARISPHVHTMAGRFPLHGYLPSRGTHTALRRVFQHCEDVRKLCLESAASIHDMKAGKFKPRCVGGLQVFIDLSKAFDVLPRSKLYDALIQSGAPRAEIELIMLWHVRAHYFLNDDRNSPGIATSRGVRQGCKAAPTLWLAFSALICELLDKRLYPGWCGEHLVIYADDHHVSFCFRTLSELEAALHAIGIIYTGLHAIGMEVSASKSACIFTYRGTLKGTVHKRFVGQFKDQKVLKVPNGASTLHIPIVSEHIYLGTVVSYSQYETQTLRHRINIARSRYFQLKTVLNNRGHMTRRDRLNMWMTCIWSTMSYGLVECGVTKQGCVTLQSIMLQHVRAIVASPAHIDKVSDAEILRKYNLLAPHGLLLRLASKRLENACHRDPNRPWTAWFQSAPWAVTVRDTLKALQTDFMAAERAKTFTTCDVVSVPDMPPIATTSPDADAAPLRSAATEPSGKCTCASCGQSFDTQRSLRVHEATAHKILPDKSGVFVKALHAKDGLPVCASCGKKFSRWSGLARHIEQHRCPGARDAAPSTSNASTLAAGIRHDPEAMSVLRQQGLHQFALHGTFGRILKQSCACVRAVDRVSIYGEKSLPQLTC